MSYGVGGRRGLDPTLLWLWCGPVATAPIRSLAWELPYAAGAALEKAKRQKINKKINKKKKIKKIPLLRKGALTTVDTARTTYKHFDFHPSQNNTMTMHVR